MRTNLRTRVVVAVAAPLLTVGLAGCGGNNDGKAAASDTTVSASPSGSPSADASPDASGPSADSAQLFDDMLTAMKDKGTATIAMSMGSAGTAKGQIDYSSSTPAMALKLSTSGMDGVEMRLVDGEMYMSMPPMTPAGKFFKLDDSLPGMGESMKSLESLTQFSPEKTAAMMRNSLKSLKKVGTVDIDGDTTTQYKVVVDGKKSLDELDLPSGTSANVPKRLTYDLFVTDDSLIRRMQMKSAGQNITIDYTDWGAPVTIEAPAAADLVKVPGT